MDQRQDRPVSPVTGSAQSEGGAAGTPGPIRREFAPWNDPGAEPLVEFRAVTKRFGDFVAVDDLSLKIYRREFHALLGPSGCGKTTLMRMVAGFEMPSEGQVLLNGTDLGRTPPYERPVNMMFQSYALFPHMTVEKNIAFGLKQDGLARDKIAARVEEMLDLVQLQQFRRRKPHQLSGGQKQRVALARSLAKRPEVLLLDEPLGALDKKLREETQFELMDVQEKLGMTFIIVTHDQEEAMTVADRITVMDHGRIIQSAPPAEIYEMPNSRYVADFIGDINFIPGRIFPLADGVTGLRPQDCETLLSAQSPGEPFTENDEAVLAVRPEKVRVSKSAPAQEGLNVLKGTIWDIAYLGNVSVFHVKISEGLTVKATMTNGTRRTDEQLTWDDEVCLSFEPASAVILTR